ncbi:MAG: ATP-dependent Clp protease ATP-binding subunit, partial [Clostridia bacterium]|nr:ATP-dependent Clp protease ATP-binding subunit [Clostridia bacterium]
MMDYKFTKSANKALELASEIAIKLGHNYVGTEHLLYGLAEEKTGVAGRALERQDITPEKILDDIEELIGKNEDGIDKTLGFTPRSKKVFENAFKESKKIDSDYIGTEHILVGIIRETDSIAARIISDLGIDIQIMYNEIMQLLDEQDFSNDKNMKNTDSKGKGSYSHTSVLNQYSVDLTIEAKKGKLDNIVGRNREIERVIQILTRRTKNNPCLIGEPGVGKTSIAEGLAEKIVSDDVPEMLKNKRVVSLDISSMVAGAKYRGDFEDRIKKSLNEVRKVKDVILFIDEIHTIVGAGAAEGAIDAANILKPLLSRGEIQVIGATTINEYRKYIEKDAALERRFSSVMVEEPSTQDTVLILKGIRDKYELHHNVRITDEALEEAVLLSSRYINDRFLPDKAIDIIDEAASMTRMKKYTLPERIKNLEEEISITKKAKEDAINIQNFEEAAMLRDKEEKQKMKIDEEKEKWNEKNIKAVTDITKEDIANIISTWTSIPVQKITQDENEKLRNLEESLHKRVVGQNEAIEAVAKAIRRGRVGLKDPNRPIGSFLFLGPTGVGKTETAKALTVELFGNENAMIRLDMSEFMEGHSVAKLIGAPPGYVGFDEGGQLTEKVRRKPYSVILFDEIEKAHPDVMNILLQVLEDGRLTDSTGRTVDFKNTVIILTSNIGASLINKKKTLGFTEKVKEEQQREYEDIKKEVMAEVKRNLKPEFINRIDEIIVFHKLNDKEIEKIIELLLIQVEKRLSDNGYNINIDRNVIEEIKKQGYDKNYGARPLRRSIQTLVEDKNMPEKLRKQMISALGK